MLIYTKSILPTLKKCVNCNIFKCKWCLKFSANCSLCRQKRCRVCCEFNKSKDILINCSKRQISNYVSNFLTDYFLVSDTIAHFFNLSVSEEMKHKNPFFIYDGKIKKIWHYKQSATTEKIHCEFRGQKRCFYFKK